MFVCVVSLSQPSSSRDLVYPLWDVPSLRKRRKKSNPLRWCKTFNFKKSRQNLYLKSTNPKNRNKNNCVFDTGKQNARNVQWNAFKMKNVSNTDINKVVGDLIIYFQWSQTGTFTVCFQEIGQKIQKINISIEMMISHKRIALSCTNYKYTTRYLCHLQIFKIQLIFH